MRVGGNPQKAEGLITLKTNHRVVMVVFVPELTGYYTNMFEVTKLSINSLIKTIPLTSAITIVDNGSCSTVTNYLTKLLKEGLIDALMLLKNNIGKIDALMAGARGAREPIITLTDCDILFEANWVSETIKVFNTFKNVGSVSPIPTRTAVKYFTFSTQQAILQKRLCLKFESIPENFKAYNMFLKSINWNQEPDKFKLWPVVINKNVKAIVGSDHQVVTLRRDILFNCTPSKPSFTKVGKESERDYVDLAIDMSGGFRLSTYHFYAFHMGNKLENWMTIVYDKLENNSEELDLKLFPKLKYQDINPFWYKFKKKLLKKVFETQIPSNY
ncbi:glycosyltransferase [Tamlana fucoidanivorans]|uniref:Glycosyltransferase family 2 protein n=1 Tax=Allotamlana fucoidanivorans TaxID=2583814 RepID=A0A5C4SPM8_9FLAO|nr:glycosyltransferase [Tamlana fucoidanivorans]TNJ45763.1 glycosyltransferase family 2 protein [Tamlana fucoidanivorans]